MNASDGVFDQLDQFALADRFEQVVRRPQLERIGQRIDRGIAHQKEDLRTKTSPFGGSQKFETVDTRHLQVGQRNIDSIVLDPFPRRRRIGP